MVTGPRNISPNSTVWSQLEEQDLVLRRSGRINGIDCTSWNQDDQIQPSTR